MAPGTSWFPDRAAAVAAVVLLAAVLGCGGGSASASDDAGRDTAPTAETAPADAYDAPMIPSSDQVPPQRQATLEPWLGAGSYKQWTCETTISNPRPDPMNPSIVGTHLRHRICSNSALLASTAGPYPVGAASVKEIFDAGNAPYGFAVGVKIAEGEGENTWYWYERIGRLATLSPVADGVGIHGCGRDCHARATRDNVFIRAQ